MLFWAGRYLSFWGGATERGPKKCRIICCPGSKKPTLSDPVAPPFALRRFYEPVLDSSAPFCSLRDRHLLCICNDWRLNGGVPATGTLHWLEGRPFSVDVNGQGATHTEIGPIRSRPGDRMNPIVSWREIDTEEFKDR